MQHATPSVWAIIGMGAAVPVFIVLIIRMMTAKTGKAFAINFGLAQGLGIVLLLLFPISGMGLSPEELRQVQGQAPNAQEMLRAMPWELFVAGMMWIVGGNYIMIRQRRKAGESWIKALSPFAPLRYMDGRSWLQLLLLVFLSLAVTQAGLVRSPPHLPRSATPTQHSHQ
jgi:hypothetical protein